MIRFRFGLTPLAEVEPWGAGRELHWFGLTDGWYGIDAGGHELLRYSERTVRELRGEGERDGRGAPHPYVEYYVVRLWEDLLALVSGAMEPVPPDLVGIAAEVEQEWPHLDTVETPEADAALTWHGAGYLYTGYLRIAPAVRLWRTVVGDDDTVTVAWRHEPDPEGVIEFTGPRTGRVTVPTSAFVAAVAELDRALLAAMDQRIAELAEFGAASDVRLDVEQLRRDHHERARRLPRALAHAPRTDWDAVRTGLRALLGRTP
ncbi:DUF5984 family protein [Streptomyces sp. NBC_00448]|uniref:DUF5984 family protein n=1 Tax=Streptomyces sp. NBC_00448 TaxID=2903652 RepID=UPI002E2235F7